MSDPNPEVAILASPQQLVWRPILDGLPEPAAIRSPVKRAVDVVGGLLLLVLAAPVVLLTAALVHLTSPGAPALFSQPRIGTRGRPFRMYKIRTMVPGAERLQSRMTSGSRVFFKLADDPRVTRVGRFLRKYSIDEIPQLWNVIRGDMSLVGPRPLLLSDFDRMPVHRQLERFAVRPGVTGLWQVSGRSHLSDEERMELDLVYVRHWSVAKDLGILLRTIPAVLRGEGAT